MALAISSKYLATESGFPLIPRATFFAHNGPRNCNQTRRMASGSPSRRSNQARVKAYGLMDGMGIRRSIKLGARKPTRNHKGPVNRPKPNAGQGTPQLDQQRLPRGGRDHHPAPRKPPGCTIERAPHRISHGASRGILVLASGWVPPAMAEGGGGPIGGGGVCPATWPHPFISNTIAHTLEPIEVIMVIMVNANPVDLIGY